MKKSKNSPVKIISKDELNELMTKQLLSRLNRLRECDESFEQSDCLASPDLEEENLIYFKNTQKWQDAYRLVKEVLKDREHVPKWKTM